MRNIVKSLGLNDEIIDIYLNCYDKRPLTFGEIHSFNPEMSNKKIENILDILIENDLIIKIESRHSNYLNHYFAMPPLKAIEDLLIKLKTEQTDAEISAKGFKYHLQELRKNVENDLENARLEIIQSIQQTDLKEENLEYLDQFQNNIKKLFAVQIKNVLAFIRKFMDKQEINQGEIQTIEQFTSEKVNETNSIIERMFKEFNEIINEYAVDIIETQFNSNSILLDNIKKSLISNLTKFLEEEKPLDIEVLDLIINSLVKYNKPATLGTEIFNEKIWLITSKVKFFEEISDIINQNSSETIIILSDTIEEFFNNFEKKEIIFANKEIKLVSGKAHDYPLIKNIREKFPNIQYKKLENDNLIGAKEGNKVVLGTLLENSKGKLNNFIGIGTNYRPLYKALVKMIDNRWDSAKPETNILIANEFDDIIKNINEYSGKKIGQKLEEILNIAFQKEGISLKLLELRILLSTLKNIYSPLNYDLKEKVIETIDKLNSEFTSLPLEEAPELESFPFESEEDKKYQQELEQTLDLRELEPVDNERIKHLFELFIEKISDLNGNQISKQIVKMTDLVLQLQGFSDIIKWRNKLSDLDKDLDEPIREEIIKDFLKWKYFIIETSKNKSYKKEEKLSSHLTSQAQLIPEQKEKQKQNIKSTTENVSVGQNKIEVSDEYEEFSLNDKFETLKQKSIELPGTELSSLLQEIADVLLLSKGAMAIRDMRNFISKLRSIRDPLEDEMRDKFVSKVDEWIEKFG